MEIEIIMGCILKFLWRNSTKICSMKKVPLISGKKIIGEKKK